MMQYCLDVSGKYACFTRPEHKVERVTYEFITPSAARGIFDTIYWHPNMYWKVFKIEVLKPIKFRGIKRNEVSYVIPNTRKPESIYIEDNRTQ